MVEPNPPGIEPMVRRFIRSLTLLAGCSYLIFGCALYAYQRELLYPGKNNVVPAEIPRASGLRPFRAQTSAGESDAWHAGRELGRQVVQELGVRGPVQLLPLDEPRVSPVWCCAERLEGEPPWV